MNHHIGAIATATPQSVVDAQPWRISYRVLLGIYGILPLCVIGFILDRYVWGGYLRDTLPRAPETFLFFSLLFGTPHIVASNIIFLTNSEYVKIYWRRAVLMTLGIIAFFAIGSQVLTYNIMFSIVATATVMHVVKQQIGIGNVVGKLSGGVYQLWVWTMIGSSVVMYNGIFLQNAFTERQLELVDLMLVVAGGVIVWTAIVNHFRMASPRGKWFLWANTLMIVSSFYFYSQKYYFFAVLGPRIVHDVTAFVVYVVHDHNRHRAVPQNTLYRLLKELKINALIAVPALAILVTLFLQDHADTYFSMVTNALLGRTFSSAIAFGFVGYLGLMHYYMESFTWKGQSPYKKYVSFML